MNEKSELEVEVEVVELGDAKQLTKGLPTPLQHEENPSLERRFKAS